MIQEIIARSKESMENAVKGLQNELGRIRTGRANLAVLDGVRVDYYGTPTPLKQVASLSVPEARLITIQPWEANLVPAIEKAVLEANIGLTPMSDGKIVRLPIPKLTEERRKEIVKQVKHAGEESRVAVRHVRREANDALKKLKDVSEDEVKRTQEAVQKLTDETVAKIDGIVAKKEQDVLTV